MSVQPSPAGPAALWFPHHLLCVSSRLPCGQQAHRKQKCLGRGPLSPLSPPWEVTSFGPTDSSTRRNSPDGGPLTTTLVSGTHSVPLLRSSGSPLPRALGRLGRLPCSLPSSSSSPPAPHWRGPVWRAVSLPSYGYPALSWGPPFCITEQWAPAAPGVPDHQAQGRDAAPENQPCLSWDGHLVTSWAGPQRTDRSPCSEGSEPSVTRGVQALLEAVYPACCLGCRADPARPQSPFSAQAALYPHLFIRYLFHARHTPKGFFMYGPLQSSQKHQGVGVAAPIL